jgi:hypothetical protein
MTSAPTPAVLARQLSTMLLSMAEELADPAIPEGRRKWLEDHVERLWRFDLFQSESLNLNAQIATLVEAIAVSARAREEDEEGRMLYLNAGLLHFRTRFPGRATRFANLRALEHFNAAVLVWNARGRSAGKWQAIAKVAASIRLSRDHEQIRQIWEDARRRDTRKMRGTAPAD